MNDKNFDYQNILPRYSRQRILSQPDVPRGILEAVCKLDEQTLSLLAGALHGAKISQCYANEKEALAIISRTYPAVERAASRKWDFVCHETKTCFDLKSPGYNNNVPPENFIKKYADHLPEGYAGVFVVDGYTYAWESNAEIFKQYNISIRSLASYAA